MLDCYISISFHKYISNILPIYSVQYLTLMFDNAFTLFKYKHTLKKMLKIARKKKRSTMKKK